MELGQTIVRQLDLDQRRDVVSRWMAHHLAELITTAETAKGEAKQQAEDRAVELILKLWANRRELPTPADPLHGHMDAIKVLGALLPTSNPWRYSQRRDSYSSLLRDIFDQLVNVVISGLLLTHGMDMRKIEDAEWDALSQEERSLVEALDRWRDFFAAPGPERTSFAPLLIRFVGSGGEEGPAVCTSDTEASETTKPDAEREQPAAILAHLEECQAKLSELIERWREEGVSHSATEAPSAGEGRLSDET